MDFDVIVIGTGIGGLTAASRLAVLGYKVGVFEQHFIPGGYATNFKRKGYEFDVSLHGIGGLDVGGNIQNILSACNVMDKIIPLKNKDAYSIMLDGKLTVIPNNKDEYKELLINKYPHEENGIEKLFSDIDKFKDGFSRFILNKDSKLIKKLHKNVLLFINWSGKTTYEVVSKYIKDEELIRVFTALWTYYGLPPKELSAIYYFIPWISYHYYGKYYIQGGAQQLSNKFVEVIKEHNGEIYLNKKVKEINCDNNKVYGIKLENGQQYTCRFVISNNNPISTIDMLDNKILKDKEVYKIKNEKVGCSLSQLYIGLDCNPSYIGIQGDEVFFLEADSHEEDYNLAKNNEYSKCGFLLTNYNSMDKSLNSHDKGVITVTFIDNYNFWSNDKKKYKEQKKAVEEKIIERLEKYYKGISSHIVVLEFGTPKTMERYTGNIKGAVYGYAQYVSQCGRHRLKAKTSINNLSFVGAWINPGGGYEGAISGAMVEAQRISKILKD